jgi:hypothetical protein
MGPPGPVTGFPFFYYIIMSGFVSRCTYKISIYYLIGDLKVLTSKVYAKLL